MSCVSTELCLRTETCVALGFGACIMHICVCVAAVCKWVEQYQDRTDTCILEDSVTVFTHMGFVAVVREKHFIQTTF